MSSKRTSTASCGSVSEALVQTAVTSTEAGWLNIVTFWPRTTMRRAASSPEKEPCAASIVGSPVIPDSNSNDALPAASAAASASAVWA